MTIELVLCDTAGNRIFRDEKFPTQVIPRAGERINFYVKHREREYLFDVVSVTHDYCASHKPIRVVARYEGNVMKD